jgi:hypothetical protein
VVWSESRSPPVSPPRLVDCEKDIEVVGDRMEAFEPRKECSQREDRKSTEWVEKSGEAGRVDSRVLGC